jgi:hypothetical protein
MQFQQWDIVRFKIRSQDRDLHPGIVISGPELCANANITSINALACSKKPPGGTVQPYNIMLNGADGLDFQSGVDCRFFHIVPKEAVTEIIGRVATERRRAISRKVAEVFRLLL